MGLFRFFRLTNISVSHSGSYFNWIRLQKKKSKLPLKTDCFTSSDKSSGVYYASIDYACARDAVVCVITVGSQSPEDQQPADLDHNLKIFKDIIPNVCKYAPSSVLLILSNPGTFCYSITVNYKIKLHECDILIFHIDRRCVCTKLSGK